MFYIKNLNLNIPKIICKNLNIMLPVHSRLAIIGRNGVGKSSLLKYILRPLLAGKILYEINNNLIDIATLEMRNIAKYIAYASQKPKFYEHINIEQLIDFAKPKILSKDITKYIDKFNIPLLDLADLSGGEMQLAHIITTLIQDSYIILLDEPTTYLDWINKQQILELMIERSLNYSCIIIAIMHDVENLSQYFTHKLYLMGEGQWQFDKL